MVKPVTAGGPEFFLQSFCLFFFSFASVDIFCTNFVLFFFCQHSCYFLNSACSTSIKFKDENSQCSQLLDLHLISNVLYFVFKVICFCFCVGVQTLYFVSIWFCIYNMSVFQLIVWSFLYYGDFLIKKSF